MFKICCRGYVPWSVRARRSTIPAPRSPSNTRVIIGPAFSIVHTAQRPWLPCVARSQRTGRVGRKKELYLLRPESIIDYSLPRPVPKKNCERTLAAATLGTDQVAVSGARVMQPVRGAILEEYGGCVAIDHHRFKCWAGADDILPAILHREC